MKKILSILLLLVIKTPLIALDYYTLPDKDDKEKSYLYTPLVKNHFLIKYDIKDLNKLILKLKKPNSKISTFIKNELTDNTKELVDKYDPDTSSNETIKLAIINDLNTIIENKKLYKNKEIVDLSPSISTENKIVRDKKDQIMRNRLVINEAFKKEINGWMKDDKEELWKRSIQKNEDPYKYLRGVNKEKYIHRTLSITFSVEESKEENNKKEIWDIPIEGKIYLRATGTVYQINSITNKKQENKTITLKIKGRKINNRIYLNLYVKTKNNDIYSTTGGNIHIKTAKDGLIEKNSFFAFTRKIKDTSKEYIRIRGEVIGNIENPTIKANMIDVNGREIGHFEGTLSLKELLLK